MRILFVASECSPFIKVGGLADVVGALPRALAEAGHDVRVLVPRFGHLDLGPLSKHASPLAVPLGDSEAWCGIYESRLPGSTVPVYFLDHQALFGRGYVYDPPGGRDEENLIRFALLSRGAFALCRHLQFEPDIFHAHDWPSALVPLYLNTIERERFGDAASVMTIHNLAHQGYGPMSQLAVAQVPSSEIKADGLEHFGLVNLFKGGLYHASKITTVSPTYAWEIRTPEGGHGLDHVLRFRGADVLGILNGIDTDVWNPATDPHLPAHFDVDDLSGKDVCKAALQREMGLDVDPSRPIFGVVSRLHEQKGIDIICGAAQGLVERGAQLVVLGTGDPDLEGWLRHLDWIHRPVAVRLRFDEGLAHRIEAGSDFFLMPSRFEPCGLNQMYSQRYGTLPVVREVGGLVDSVDQYDPATARGTGFRFFDLDVPALLGTCQWALDTWWHRPDHIHALRQQGMRKEWGWDVAAAEYENVYRWAREARGVV